MPPVAVPRTRLTRLLALGTAALCACLAPRAAGAPQDAPKQSPAVPAPAGQSTAPYGTGTWDADTYGNHRAVVKVAARAEAVWVHIPWRRRDNDADKKQILVIDPRSNNWQVKNVARPEVTREYADIVFEALTPGEYHVYYMPYRGTLESNYPKITYIPAEATANGSWLARNVIGTGKGGVPRWKLLPRAQVVRFESIDEFNSFHPMEVVATGAETRALLAKGGSAGYLLFAEDRKYPIRMTDDLPLRWIERGPNKAFSGEAARGESYWFQIGFYALQPITDVEVSFGGFSSAPGGKPAFGADTFRCINFGGTDWMGRPFRRPLAVRQGKVQPLWCGVEVPAGASPGRYTGTLTVLPLGLEKTALTLNLTVSKETIPAAGDDEPWRQSRLRWLDSTLALDDEIVPPYTPVAVSGRMISVLGRDVTIDELGFPASIVSRFAPEMTYVSETGREILAGPVRIVVDGESGKATAWKGEPPAFTKQAPGVAAWQTALAAGPLSLHSSAEMEFDGNIEYRVELKAAAATSLRDVRLEIPIVKNVARYLMGLGAKGGVRPVRFEWTWKAANNQDSAWVGDVNAGLQFTLKDDSYVRPLNTNFYLLKPLVMPKSWHNAGKGGCRIGDSSAKSVLISCYSGPRAMAAGETLRFDFRLLVTPFKPLDPSKHFSTRYLHAYCPVEEAAASGANTINIHHATDINPFINYPFLRPAELKAYVDAAHRRNLKVKIYYTVRELSNRAPELFALRSLGDEVLAHGPGGGFSWLQEHLGSNYIAGWFVPSLKDSAVVNSGVSRWHNYYVEGLNWLVKNVGIDGLYIDDVAFDRTTMKRVKKVLERGRPGSMIDLHSANQFNQRDGFANSANLYLEHFPFLDRLWFGEYFDYNAAPDFWLVEMSGIPFGLMGEMLQDGGNPWRGMLFGMTGRLPRVDNTAMWKAWDDFGIASSRMVGFWVDYAPVKTGNPAVHATSYIRDGKTMVALASWAPDKVAVKLEIDWKALGIEPAGATIVAPAIDKFQDAATFAPDAEIPVEPGKGWLLVVTGKDRSMG
ncbi:MAG: glycoside hydrolase domain-containing protein [Vicinamibacterales bacterium]